MTVNMSFKMVYERDAQFCRTSISPTWSVLTLNVMCLADRKQQPRLSNMYIVHIVLLLQLNAYIYGYFEHERKTKTNIIIITFGIGAEHMNIQTHNIQTLSAEIKMHCEKYSYIFKDKALKPATTVQFTNEHFRPAIIWMVGFDFGAWFMCR